MKKLIALILALVMVLALTACGGGNAAQQPAAAEEAAAAEEPAAAPDETTGGDTASYHIGVLQLVEHVALDAATQGFIDALTEKLGDGGVTFDVQNAQGEQTNCSTIANGFVADNVDLIMANATPALQAARSATSDIPILGTSVTDYASGLDIELVDDATGINISGTSDLAELSEQADMLAELFPAEENPNVGIVYCSAEANSVYQADTIQEALEALGYTVTQYTFADSNDIASVVQNACDASDVLYIPTDNTAASNAEAIDNVALPAGVPIIAGEEGICSGCGVATLSISYYDLGYKTGEMAYDILVGGADISTMPIAKIAQTKEYDADRCAALGIEVPDDYVAIEG